MKKFLTTLFDPDYIKITLTLLISGIVLIVAGFAIGIADNTPGIAVMYVGLTLLLLAFIYLWRTSKPYLFLMLVSFVGGIVFAVLHNLFDGLADRVSDLALLPQILEGLGATAFIIAVILCPVGIFAGFFGAVVTYFLKRNQGTAS